MIYLLIRWVILAIAIGVTAWLFPGIAITGESYFLTLILIAAVFGLVNAVVRPIVTLLTCPLVVLTLGLFILVINAFMLLFTGWLVPSFQVDGFWTAFWASIVISIVSFLLNLFVTDEGR